MEPVQKEKLHSLTFRFLLYFLPLVGITGIIIPIGFHHYDLALLGTYLAVPMILTPVVFLFLKDRLSEPKNDIHLLTNFPLFTITTIFFVFLWTVNVILLYIFEIRPWIFYFLISILGVIVCLEILYCSDINERVAIVLTQNILILLTVIWGVNLKYYQYIGRTDLLGHLYWIQKIIDTGHVTDIFGVYKTFPLWQILSSSTTILMGYMVSVPRVMFFVNGIIYAILIIFVYLIINKIQPDVRISLIASLLTVFNIDILIYGMYSISRSIVTFLLLVLIFILVMKKSHIRTAIIILLGISLIIYHTVSMPFILVLLFAIYFLSIFYGIGKDRLIVNLREILIIGALTLVYWIFNANQLFETVVNNTFLPLSEHIITNTVFSSPLYEFANYIQYIPLLFFILIGVLISLYNRDSPRIITVFCLIGMLLVPFALPGPSLLIEKLSNNLNLDRFGEYSIIFFSIAAAIGVYYVFNRTQKVGKAFLIILIAGLFLFSVSNDFIASDNPFVKRPIYTFYLTQNEIESTTILTQYAEGYVMADYAITRLISFSDSSSSSHIIEMDKYTLTPLKIDKADILLIRKAEFSKRPLKMYSVENHNYVKNPSWLGTLDYYYYNEIIINNLNYKYSKIFDSESINAYN